MSWSGGTYTKGNAGTGGWSGDASSGIGIEAGRHDTQDNDFQDGINNCLTKDGQNTPTANLPMNGYKHTNVADASSSNQYMAFGQISNGSTTVNVGSITGTKFTSATATNVKSDWYMLGASDQPNVHRHYKTRGATTTSYDAVTDGDQIGRQDYIVSNGSSFVTAARFAAVARGLVGSNYPAYFAWSTVGSTGSIADRMRLSEDGKLLVNETLDNLAQFTATTKNNTFSAMMARSDVAGDVGQAAFQIRKTDNNSTTSQVFARFTINNGAAASGQINANGANQAAFGSTSDARLKENIVDLPSQLANVMALRPVEFDYKDGSGHQIGFIAQEVQEIYPDLVGEQADGYLNLSGLGRNEARLIKAFQEFATLTQGKIASLEARIEALENA